MVMTTLSTSDCCDFPREHRHCRFCNLLVTSSDHVTLWHTSTCHSCAQAIKDIVNEY